MFKVLPFFKNINANTVRGFLPDLVIWGGAAGAAVATFTEGWPLFQQVFYSKIPMFGKHWIHDVDPEDVPV